MGTPRYMAPEQAMGRNREVDARSDIFAFGCIVYEMLCGDSPFAGGTIAEVVYRVVHEQPESLASRMPDLPGRAVSAVDRALAKAPKDRYPDVATFIAELTGTALQSLSGLGADPTPFPPRGAVRQNDPSVNEEEGTDATFVPSRSGVAGAVGSPAPQTPAGTPEPSLERGSTLAAFRFAEQQAPAQPTPSAATPGLDPQPRLAPVPAPHPAATPGPASRSKSPLILAAIGGVLLLAGGIFVGGKVLTPSNPPGPVTPPPATVTEAPPPAVTPPVTATPPATPPPTVTPETTPPVTPPPVTPPPVNPTVASGSSSPRPSKPETIPEEVRQELAEAEKALASGELDRALRIAWRTQQTKPTEAANYLIGRVYCQRKDLGNAKAQWRKLTGSKSKLAAYCRKYEIDL